MSWLALGSAAPAALAARARPDALVLDLQHGLWERRELEAAIGQVPSGIPVLVRVWDPLESTCRHASLSIL